MRFLFAILLSGLFLDNCHAQSFQLDENLIHIRAKGSKEYLYSFDWKSIYAQSSRIIVKDRLGSFKVKFKRKRKGKICAVSLCDSQTVLLKTNQADIKIQLKVMGNNSMKLLFGSNQKYNHWHIPFIRMRAENFFGGGIQFSNYSDYNRIIVNLTQENGIGRGGGSISKWAALAGIKGEPFATYCPMSSISSSTGRSFSWNDYAYAEVELSLDHITFDILDDSVFFELANPVDAIKKEQLQPYELPDWSMGTIVGMQGGTQKVLNKLKVLFDVGVKIDALWIQDWVGKQATSFGSRLRWVWQLDTLHYSQFNRFKDQLNQRDIKLLGYINPFFAANGHYVEEGISKGYFLTDKGQTRSFKFGGIEGYMIDLYNADAFNWMKQIIQLNMVDQGFSGWMADFAEWYPIDAAADLTIDALKKHNEYPVLWAKLNQEVIVENPTKELFFFNRSGGKGAEDYSAMMWAGDQMVDYSPEDGLGSVFDAYLSATHSGLPLIHSDVGGYTSVKKPIIKHYIRSEKLLKDWMLLEAFTPVFRTHEGLLPEDNIQVYSNLEIAQSFKRFSDIHRKLRPYFEELVLRWCESATPIFGSIDRRKFNLSELIPGFSVGDKIMILNQRTPINYDAFKESGWKFVDTSGAIIDQPSESDHIIVAIKDLKW